MKATVRAKKWMRFHCKMWFRSRLRKLRDRMMESPLIKGDKILLSAEHLEALRVLVIKLESKIKDYEGKHRKAGRGTR